MVHGNLFETHMYKRNQLKVAQNEILPSTEFIACAQNGELIYL